MTSFRFFLLVLIGFIGLGSGVGAQNWTGAVSSDWNNGANWSSWPLGGADVVIDPSFYSGLGASPSINATSVFSPNSILVSNGGDLIINANLTVGEDLEADGVGSTIVIQQGSIQVGPGNNGRFIFGAGAAGTMNGGTVNADQRFLMDMGGTFVLNNGAITVGEVMALADADVSGPSRFVMNNGSLSVGLELALGNEFLQTVPSVTIHGGTVMVNGDITWSGVAPGSGQGRFVATAGAINVNGSLVNMAGSTMQSYLELSGTAQMNVSGAGITQLLASDSVVMAGNSILQFSGNGAIWTNPGVITATGGVVVAAANTSLTGPGSCWLHHLTIANGRSFTHVSPLDLRLGGNLTNNGTFVHGNNRLHLVGTGAQTISGSATTVLANLIANHSGSGITLLSPVTVTQSLTLTNGIFHTSTQGLLRLTDNTTSDIGSTASHVDGPMQKAGDDAFVFPVGNDGIWSRISITAPNTASEFTAEYHHHAHNDLVGMAIPLTHVSGVEFWTLDRVNGSGTVQVNAFWEDAIASMLTACPQVALARYDGVDWQQVPATVNGICNGNGSGNVLSNAALSSFGAFALGATGNVVSQHLTLCNGDTAFVGNHAYAVSGLYMDVLTANGGGDSTVYSFVDVLPAIATSQNFVGCVGDSLVVGASTYTQTGVFVDTLVSVQGCDSVVTSNILFHPHAYTLQQFTLCFGEQVQVGLHSYSQSGTYFDTLSTVVGCDSVVETMLTVQNPVNIGISVSGDTLSSIALGDTWQWLDCSNGFSPILGADSANFIPAATGNYAVLVTTAGCQDTSLCQSMTIVALDAQALQQGLTVYPNPAACGSDVQLTGFESIEKSIFIDILDPLGKVIRQEIRENNTDHVQLHTT
ncbi:MAG: hypothetical protein RLZZ519_3362, partial [Bacteroidota bacterium]